MTEELEFAPWPKTARLNRDVIVTEKIDGTNAAVRVISPVGLGLPGNLAAGDRYEQHILVEDDNERPMLVGAQSRKKIITPEKDNFGFARWVFENAQALASTLGDGLHFGEWYGSGIQRAYTTGQPREKRFMLFNTTRWGAPETRELLCETFDGRVEVATVLYEGPFNTHLINFLVAELRDEGSKHVSGFGKPEGVIVHHTQAAINFKVTCEKDELPKGVSEPALAAT